MKKLLSIFAIAAVMTSCNNSANNEEQIRLAKQATLDSISRVQADQQREEMARQHVIDSMNLVAANNKPARRVIERTTVTNSESRNAGYTTPAASAPTAAAPKKKGWTGATKGAIIGAGAGAITGAMVDGRKGEGAIVGGLLGAGAGAATGAIIDKEKKKKEAQKQNGE